MASEWVRAEIKVFADHAGMTNGDIKLNFESLERSGFPCKLKVPNNRSNLVTRKMLLAGSEISAMRNEK